MDTSVANVLAMRYASTEMCRIFWPAQTTYLMRRLWYESIQIQHELGVPTPEGAVAAYRIALSASIDAAELAKIDAYEHTGNHDVVAHKRAYDEAATAAAGSLLDLAHKGLTSRDCTDNVEQLQIREGLIAVRDKYIAVLARVRHRALVWRILDAAGKSHIKPGQETTLGMRFSSIGEGMLGAFEALEHFIETYRFRGFKGAMGTRKDLIHLLGSVEKAFEYERRMCKQLGIERVLDSTGQVYGREQDTAVVFALCRLAAPLGNLSWIVRLLAAFDQMIEGFGEGRKGSSAMPHKQNPSRSERIHALLDVLKGQCMTLLLSAGEQILEGDVSCSVTRRVAIPDAFYAIDGILETALTILDEMEVFPEAVEAELLRELPFLTTTALRLAAVVRGVPDVDVYAAIQRHTKAAAADITNRGGAFFNLVKADKEHFPFSDDELAHIMLKADHGAAEENIDRVVARIDAIINRSDSIRRFAEYKPHPVR